jgi:hypothetical protein
MKTLVDNVRGHLSLLWMLRKQLIIGYKTQCANVPNVANAIKEMKGFYNGSKLHIITHLPEFKLRFGAYRKTTDTELSEHSHLDYVKKAYNHTNKKNSEIPRQMLLQVKRITHCNNMNNYNSVCKDLIDNARFRICTANGHDVIHFIENKLLKEVRNGKQSQATYATDSSLVNKVLLSLNDLYLFIDKSVESNLTVPKEFVTGWINFKLEYKKLKLLRAIEYVQKDGNNPVIGDYKITCDSDYKENSHQRVFVDNTTKQYNQQTYTCNFVEVSYLVEDRLETEVAQVVAMIEFVNPQAIVKNVTNTGKDSEIYVVIAWLKRNNDSQANKMFPYPSFSYNYESNNNIKMKSKPLMQIISVESISCPAFIIPNQKKGFFWDKRSLQPKTVLQNVTFYQVPYERAFRRYCNGFVEYTDSYSSQDQYKSGSNNYIPTNVIMCENDLVIVDNMIKTIDDQLQYPEENDTDSFNSIVNEDINYDSNEEEDYSVTSR